MKQKRVLLVAMIFVFLAVIWMFVLQQFLKIDQTKEQNEYVAMADDFSGKKLYVRAIDAYKKALGINTTAAKKAQIEKKLLDVYFTCGDMLNYEDLAEQMIKSGDVSDDEIVKLTQTYFDSYLIEDALETARKGLMLFPENQEIQEKYDEIRFMYSINNLEVSDIKPDGDTGKYAACLDGSWIYVNSSGSIVYKVTFDEALPFYKDSEGEQYAVVKSEGRYYVINGDCALYGRDDTGVEEVAGIARDRVIAKKDGKYGFYDYDFVLKSDTHRYDLISLNSNGVVAVMNDGKWGVISDTGESIIPLELNDIALNSLNQAFKGGNGMVKRGNAWTLVDLNGNQVGDSSYADAKAPEGDGLIAVANDQSKWGFIDRDGNLVIDYQYEDAYSFSDDVAAVKTITGWEYINSKNEKIIEENFTEALPFHNGCAIVKRDDSYMTVTFDNYK